MNQTNPARLRWACRRGMLELDVLLGNFLEEAYPSLSLDDQQNFIDLLSCQDQDLFLWLTGKLQAPDFKHAQMVEKVRYHAKTRHHHKPL